MRRDDDPPETWGDCVEDGECPECGIPLDECRRDHVAEQRAAEDALAALVVEDYAGPPLCVKCATPNPNGCQLCDKCGNEPCRHGAAPGECSTCDHESDLAFDASRERSLR